MTTLIIFAVAIVPVFFVGVHVWLGLIGCVSTVTEYAAPSARVLVKVNDPFAVTARSLEPLFCNTNPVPVSPVTLPPTLKLLEIPGSLGQATKSAAIRNVPSFSLKCMIKSFRIFNFKLEPFLIF